MNIPQKHIFEIIYRFKQKYEITDTKDIENIIKKLNIDILSCDADSYADLVYKDIYINSNLNKFQKRFQTAELLFNFIIQPEDNLSYTRKYEFAYELLMPWHEFIAQVHNNTPIGTDKVNIEPLCEYFKASPQQIMTRGRQTDIFEIG